MENPRLSIALLLAFAIYTPGTTFAYSVPTHEGLTQVILEQYEKLHGDVFTAEQTVFAVEGSNAEDEDWRFMQHFYDPTNSKGLWSRYIASKEWARDTDKQGGELGYARPYFSRSDDHTWDRAVFEYVHGDKMRAAEALGHILHLIEDASVPAHVRNDAHGNLWGIGDPDTYEKYTGIFARGNVNIVGVIAPKSFSSLEQAFDNTAGFTNANFVSDSTLFKGYASPNKNALSTRGAFAYHPTVGHRVASVEIWKDHFGNEIGKEYIMDDDTNSVSIDYWNILSRHAVESGIGVIDLFFREVEKEKLTGALKAKNLSPLKQHNKKLASGFSLVKALYGSSLNQSDVNELLSDTSGQAGAAALAIGAKVEAPASVQPSTSVQAPVSQSVEESAEPVTQKQSERDIPKERNSSTENQTVTTDATTTPQIQQLVPVTPGFGGGGGGNGENGSQGEGGAVVSAPEETSVPVVEPVSLEILSPRAGDFFASSTVTFFGTTDADGVVTLESSTGVATTSADGAGNWSTSISLEEGNPAVAVSATDSVGERATSTTVSIFVDITPPSLAAVSLPQCGSSLAVTFCLIATTSVSVEWASVADAAFYAVAVDGIVGATTTATSSTATIGFFASSTIAVIAYDAAGNTSTSTSEIVYAIERPIIINEVAWAGTDATATDEWIELKNVSVFQIDLSHITLNIDDSSVALNGVLNAGDVYLIEDRAEATSATHDMVADVELSDTGAKVSLMSNDITMDSTPEIVTCSGWCAGSASSIVGTSAQHGNLSAMRSMERIAPETDGALASSWQNNDTYIRTSASKATDSSAGVVYGTPAVQNSSGLPSAGWDCGDGTLTSAGGAYNPTSSACTYLSAFVNTAANRYGDVYKGTVGSSTLVTGHLLSKSIQSSQNDDGITSGATAGDQFFVAIFETRTGPAFNTDLTDFRNYFKTGVGTTPHSNYVTIPWTYAP